MKSNLPSRLLAFFSLVAFAIFLIAFGEPRTVFAQSESAPSSLPNDYVAQVEMWREAHEKRFKSADGWLALIGHHWLKEGANRFGKDSANEIKLPSNLDELASGTFQVQSNSVWLETTKGSGVLVDGKESSRTLLAIDSLTAEADCEKRITVGDRIKLQLVRRNHRLAVRVRDKESEAIQKFQGKKWFPVDSDFAIAAIFKPYDTPKTATIINIRGDQTEAEMVGTLSFEYHGNQYTLEAMSESPDDLFVIFKDKTNGETTYEPGRFVNTKKPEDGKVLLDFNKAYNPPCAFSPHTLCPLPPAQNHLPIAITAGERRYEP